MLARRSSWRTGRAIFGGKGQKSKDKGSLRRGEADTLSDHTQHSTSAYHDPPPIIITDSEVPAENPDATTQANERALASGIPQTTDPPREDAPSVQANSHDPVTTPVRVNTIKRKMLPANSSIRGSSVRGSSVRGSSVRGSMGTDDLGQTDEASAVIDADNRRLMGIRICTDERLQFLLESRYKDSINSSSSSLKRSISVEGTLSDVQVGEVVECRRHRSVRDALHDVIASVNSTRLLSFYGRRKKKQTRPPIPDF